MQIVTTERDGITVISLTGRMDATTVASFDEAWRTCLDNGARLIVVDLGGVEYISSAGLRGILSLLKASKAAKGGLAFCNVGQMVAEVFRISGFTSMLAVFPGLDEALASLA